jgi:hypothetical protein
MSKKRVAGTGRRGGHRPGAGRPAGSQSAQTLANAAAVQTSQALTAEVVLEQIRRGACYDVRRLFDAKGQYKPIHELEEADAFMVAGFDIVRGNLDKGDGKFDDVLKVRVVDRARYVEMAAKYHGMLIDRVKVEDDKPLRQKVQKARERLAAARKASKG